MSTIEASFPNLLKPSEACHVLGGPCRVVVGDPTVTLSSGFRLKLVLVLQQPVPVLVQYHLSARRILIDGLSVVCQEKLTCYNNN
jgi:hypothetical protein